MNHSRFISWAINTPWALMPDRIAAYSAVLAAQARGEPVTAAAPVARAKPAARSGSIAVIPVYGTIVPRASQLDMCEEGTSTQQISNAVADANADPSVAKILLVIDSPGGAVNQVPELCAEIASSKKPIVGFASSLAASAGYWIGSSCSEFFMSPSAEVGSVGVWTAHANMVEALKASGVEITLISAGKFKVEGNPYEPLSDEARAFIQSRVDDYYGMFVKAVAKGRKVGVDDVRGGMGQGRCVGATEALAQNMTDGVMTLDQVIARMQKDIQSSVPRASRLAAAQRELAMQG